MAAKHVGTVAWRAAAVVGALTAGSLGWTLTATPQAQAQPNCTVTHNVHPDSDDINSMWRLELDAQCNQQSGAYDLRWEFQYWAETHDGSRITQYFNGGPGVSETRIVRGPRHYISAGAPPGHSRYCYNAVITFHGVPNTPEGGLRENRTGIHCRSRFA